MIVVDLDDTLCSFLPEVGRLIEKKFGAKIDESSLSTNWMLDSLTEEQWDTLRPLVFSPSFYISLPPICDVRFMSMFLDSAAHTKGLYYVTARRLPLGDEAESISEQWLFRTSLPRNHLGITVVSHLEDKTQFFPEQTSLVVEDNVKVAAATEEMGLPVFLFNRPWNASYTFKHPDSRRIHTYRQALKELLLFLDR